MNIIVKLMSIIFGAWEALRALGVYVNPLSHNSLAQTISTLVLRDGFEQTPELRQFPDLRIGLTSSIVKLLFLRNGTGQIGISVTLPSGKTGVINWGDGNTTALTATGAAVSYYHTWASWQASSDGLEQYNIVSITGDIASFSAIASTATAPRYWSTLKWLVIKSITITSMSITNSPTIISSALRRIDIDAPNLVLGSGAFYQCTDLVELSFNGIYGGIGSITFTGIMIDAIAYSNLTTTNMATFASGGRNQKISLALRQDVAVACNSLCSNNYTLRHFSTNTAWGTFSTAFSACYCLKELDFSGCPVNGITDFTGNTNMYALQTLLFPSTGSGISRSPKSFASGMTSMGNIDISNSGLSRAALVDMFRSLPVNASPRNLTITGSVGAADLSAEDIALATSKNWIVVRS